MAAAAGAAAGIIGGLMGMASSGVDFALQRKLQQEQRAWQERMSSTAHQREVKDLRAAGLNPILGFSKGMAGSSTPSGASGASIKTDLGGNAMNAIRLRQELSNMAAVEARDKATATSALSQSKLNTATEAKVNSERIFTEAKTVPTKIKGDAYQTGLESLLDLVENYKEYLPDGVSSALGRLQELRGSDARGPTRSKGKRTTKPRLGVHRARSKKTYDWRPKWVQEHNKKVGYKP